ncbi:MAG: hypothetical protein IPI85_06125 [Dehalococcoidia bacterium]|nr:hypothetical protein [Dehalococcoidia bacterium]
MLIVLLLSVIASALLVAGTTKVLDLQRFKRTVNSYEKLPRFTRQLAVPVVPGLELAIGFALLFGIERAVAAALGVGLLTVLGLALAIQRPRANCGCLPGAEKVPLPWHLAMLAGGVLILAVVMLQPGRAGTSSWTFLAAGGTSCLSFLFAVTHARREQSRRLLAEFSIRVLRSLHRRREEWAPDLTLSVSPEAQDWRS